MNKRQKLFFQLSIVVLISGITAFIMDVVLKSNCPLPKPIADPMVALMISIAGVSMLLLAVVPAKSRAKKPIV